MKTTHLEFSKTGQRRSNQDSCKTLIHPEKDMSLFVVCDGMGGHAMGEVASQTVCNAVSTAWSESIGKPDDEAKFRDICETASKALDERSDRFNHVEMGTTLVMASIDGETLTIAHCGDSRCYLLRNGETIFRTKDHSDPDLGCDIVTRCFFSYSPDDAKPDIARLSLQKGDRIFLCSDGVYKAAAPEILTARLMDDKPLEDIIDTIEFLCEKNSEDNYTGILIEIN